MKRLCAKWTTAKIIKVTRIIENRGMVSADVLGKMDLFMRVSGKKVWDMVMEYLLCRKLMEIKLSIEDSGRWINGMEKVDLLFQIRQWFMEILETISSKGLRLMNKRIWNRTSWCSRMVWWLSLTIIHSIGTLWFMFYFRSLLKLLFSSQVLLFFIIQIILLGAQNDVLVQLILDTLFLLFIPFICFILVV